MHGKLGEYEAAIDCYRRSIAVIPAAPAYVAWALVVAKLAAQTRNAASTTEVQSVWSVCTARQWWQGGIGGMLRGRHSQALLILF